MKSLSRIIVNTLIIFLVSANLPAIAQQKSEALNKRDLYLDLGFKYIPLDYIGGPAFGLSLYSPDKKLAINLRYDMAFSVGKGMQAEFIDSTWFISPKDNFSLEDFQVRTYIEFEYELWKKEHKKLSTCAGLGWIYDSFNNKYFLSLESGYYCVTLSAKYKFSWFFIEPRVDIPLPKSSSFHLWQPHFPGSLALIYRFKPKPTE